MLQKINRISKNKEFDRIFKTGQSFYSKTLGVKAVKNDLGVSRLGIMINTKVSKKAVIRNRLRRQIREIFHTELPQLKVGYDLVVIVFSLILDKDFQEINQILKNTWLKLDLYK